jgi:hypothetical protein
MLEKPRKSSKVMSSKEFARYVDDIAKDMGIDLSKANDEQTAKILRRASSLSDEIIENRR